MSTSVTEYIIYCLSIKYISFSSIYMEQNGKFGEITPAIYLNIFVY